MACAVTYESQLSNNPLVDPNHGESKINLDSGMVELAESFPIASQTSESDKLFLLGAQRIINEVKGEYNYLEVGSFLGGSLTPFLIDSACQKILSVDDRGRAQPDERGITYDYAGITTRTMLDNLHSKGLNTAKLITHDGAISTLPAQEDRFDLAFIDGEHTDSACFRDFIYSLRLIRDDSIIVFHDSTLVYRALKMINIYMTSLDTRFSFFKAKNSEMSAILLGRFADRNFESRLGAKEEPESFYVHADSVILKSNVLNRVRIAFGGRRLVRLVVTPPKIQRGF